MTDKPITLTAEEVATLKNKIKELYDQVNNMECECDTAYSVRCGKHKLVENADHAMRILTAGEARAEKHGDAPVEEVAEVVEKLRECVLHHTPEGKFTRFFPEKAEKIVAAFVERTRAATPDKDAALRLALIELNDAKKLIECNMRFAQPSFDSGEEPADEFTYAACFICSSIANAIAAIKATGV